MCKNKEKNHFVYLKKLLCLHQLQNYCDGLIIQNGILKKRKGKKKNIYKRKINMMFIH